MSESSSIAEQASQFVRTQLQRHPQWRDGAFLGRSRIPDEITRRLRAALVGVDDEARLMRGLREQRNREMLRIAWRAMNHGAELDETLGELSELAECCCQIALEFAQAQLQSAHGRPVDEQGRASAPVVLGMGKLGGAELNFSSDIDLIFFHSLSGQTQGENIRPLDNEQYFAKLAQNTGRIVAAVTEDGFVFRVDTLLRPFGSVGPVSMSFDAAEEYYQTHGREWERYALIKARPIAGDLEAGRALMARLRPFVYRRYLDYDAIGNLRELKQRIHDDVVNRQLRDDVKLSAGGIREVEFIVQSFQLVRGGQDLQLRNTQLRPTLKYLGECGLLPWQTANELDQAYVFLRRLENAIQMYADQQTHALPRNEAAQTALCIALGFADWSALTARYQRVSDFVHQQFLRVFAEPEREASDGSLSKAVRIAGAQTQGDQGQLRRTAELLTAAGFAAPSAPGIARRLSGVLNGRMARTLSDAAMVRLRELMAALLERCVGHDAPEVAADRVMDVIDAIIGRSTYLALLHESANARQQLVRLCASSPLISREIAASPSALDTLLDSRTLFNPPDRDQMRAQLTQRLQAVPVDDVETGMDCLRRYRQEITVRIAAADVMEQLPLVKVSDRLSWLAETVVEVALERATLDLRQSYGQVLRGDGEAAAMAILAYGKFGGIELGYGSDLDLVFVHDCDALDEETVGGERSVTAGVYLSRLVQRLIHWLSTLTPAGRAYEIDTALRPNGASGLPVVSLSAFQRYQREQAWTWEHQALARARAVAGPAHLQSALEQVRRAVLGRPRDARQLRQDVLAMRQKMRANLDKSNDDQWDVKQGRGGLIDIEFITQFLLLRDAHAHPEILRWSDNWRQLEVLADADIIRNQDKDQLIDCYRRYRAWAHRRSLQSESTLAAARDFLVERQAVEALWDGVFETE